ncbi:Arc domain-containing protein [Pseudomonas sp. ER28]|nr:Arc domain-containing protein [Pseudomonas sp. ER28]MDF3175056.1 Arc domain-containing protein [Pseudomonas sp. ER28]
MRLPEELKQWVETEAKRNYRSQTAEIVFALMEEKKRREQAAA